MSCVLQEEKQLALKTKEICFKQRELGKSLDFWLLLGVCGCFEVQQWDTRLERDGNRRSHLDVL